MKEFIQSIPGTTLANRGLRPDHRNPINQFAWVKAQNVKVIEEGLVSIDPITTFADSIIQQNGLDFNWPYPQIFLRNKETLIFTERDLFYVESDFNLWKSDLFDFNSPSTQKTGFRAGGSVWCHL